MYLKLIRNKANGSAITGRLVINGRYFCNTLERVGYQIPALCYPVKVTMSPKFKRLLPLVCGVPLTEVKGERLKAKGVENGKAETLASRPSPLASSPMRSGIRFHRGTKPEHSTGCILLPADKEIELTNLLKDAQNHEEIILEVIDFRPGTELGYNTPCPPELQKP